MLIKFNIVSCLLLVVISQSVFASGLLFFSSRNKQSNRLLAVLMITIALWLTDHFLRIAGIYRQFPNLYFLPIFYSFGFGPLIYFYARSLTNPRFRFARNHLVHFIPVIFQAALYLVLTFSPYATKLYYWDNIHSTYTYRIEFDGTWISLVIYLMLSFRLLHAYQQWLRNNYSELSKIALNWLKSILVILLVLCAQWLVEIILRDVYGIYFSYDYSILILGVIVLVLGVAGLRQINLAGINYQPDPESPKDNFVVNEQVLQQITVAMAESKLYLNPTLTLSELAQHLKLHPKVISRHINAGFTQSFNDYINSYRVEEVKRRLFTPDLERLTIMGIAFDAGFNSKTTFNRIFKSFTGKSPSEYLRDGERKR